MTLKEYLEDYASPETKAAGEKVIAEQLQNIPNLRARAVVEQHLTRNRAGTAGLPLLR